MKRAHRGLAVFAALTLASPLLVADAADARRVVGGSDKAEPEEKKDEKKDDKKGDKKDEKKSEAEKKKDAEAKKAAAEKAAAEKEAKEQAAREAAEAEEERKAREKELAEEAAERAAKEAKEKAEEAKRQAEEEKRRKEEERKEANRAARLRSAKKLRTLTREADGNLVVATLTPGGPNSEKVVEMRFDVGERLKVAHARYGNMKPLKGLRLVATVTGPDGATSYRVHPLKAAGAYGFHTTPKAAGEYSVQLTGKNIDVTFPVHVGVWPPPDFEDEEKLNAKAAAQGTGRRILK
jgi:hypothetical protein